MAIMWDILKTNNSILTNSKKFSNYYLYPKVLSIFVNVIVIILHFKNMSKDKIYIAVGEKS